MIRIFCDGKGSEITMIPSTRISVVPMMGASHAALTHRVFERCARERGTFKRCERRLNGLQWLTSPYHHSAVDHHGDFIPSLGTHLPHAEMFIVRKWGDGHGSRMQCVLFGLSRIRAHTFLASERPCNRISVIQSSQADIDFHF